MSRKFRQDAPVHVPRNRCSAGRKFEHRAVGGGDDVTTRSKVKPLTRRLTPNSAPVKLPPTRLTGKVRSSVQIKEFSILFRTWRERSLA